MAKLCYVEGEYRDALGKPHALCSASASVFALVSERDVSPGHYGKVSLDDMQLVGAPVYRLSMIAEAYATKGTNTNYFFSLLVSLSL